MRFLHTGDWHIGKRLRGRSRLEEQAAVLEEILGIALDSRIDVLLVAGDIFDSPAPSPDAERLVYDFFSRLVRERIATVLIAGNHDHPKRLEALRPLLAGLDLHIRHSPEPPAAGGVVEIARNGEVAKVAVLPFVPEHRIVDACAILGPEEDWYTEYAERVGQMIGLLSRSFETGAINLLMAHVFVLGAEAAGSERAIHIALPYAVSGQYLPATAHYVALGHLHRPQQVPSPAPTRYCGSTLQLDFGEQGQAKEVVIIEAAAGRPARVHPIVLTAGKRLRDVRGPVEQISALCEEASGEYLRIMIECTEAIPGLAGKVRQLHPNAVDVRVVFPEIAEQSSPADYQSRPLWELFSDFYRNQKGIVAPERLLEAFRQLHEEVGDAADPA